VAFVGVSYQDSVSGAEAFLQERGGGWPALQDPDGSTAIDYGVYGIPETFFIDRSGVVRYKRVGQLTASLLKHELAAIMRRPA
jgi:cytochrome c biogenesis protein CcmG/thiol:disulfide interchange protein DsbE